MKLPVSKSRVSTLLGLIVVSACLNTAFSAIGDGWEEVYSGDFESEVVGGEPSGVFILDGGFSVVEYDGGRAVKLPGSPLGEFGLLFGPRRQTGSEVTARARSETTGRRFPAFGVGLNSSSGYRLLVVPSARAVQLWFGDELVESATFTWESGEWTTLRLRCVAIGEDRVRILGRVWQEREAEPAEWLIAADFSNLPPAGKASVWGKPYSEKPILFDDLQVRAFTRSSAETASKPVGSGNMGAAEIPGLPAYITEESMNVGADVEQFGPGMPGAGFVTGAPQSFGDLSGWVPNLAIQDTSLRSFGDIFSLRGVGNTSFFSSPGVVVYLDGRPLGPAFALGEIISAVDRIEIHRGPQGAIFGRNGPGGVIEMHSKDPGSEWAGLVTAEYGSFGRSRVEANYGGPAAGNSVSLGFSGAYSEEDGYFDNPGVPAGYDRRESLSGHATVQWRPDTDWELESGASWSQFRDGAQRLSPLSGSPFSVESDFAGETRIDQNAQFLRILRRTDVGTLSLVSARYDWRLEPNSIDLDLSPIPGFTSTINQSVEQWSHEFTFESSEKTGDWPMLRVGGFYLDSKTDGDALRTFVVNTPFGPLPVNQQTVFFLGEESIAAFATYRRAVSDRLSLSVGIRVENTEKLIDRVRSDEFAPPRAVTDGSEFTEVAPSIGLEYAIDESTAVYGRVARGFKPGGFSAFSDDPQIAAFGTESFWSAEIGYRTSRAEDRLRLHVNGFWNEVSDFQVERSFTLTDYIIVNAPSVYAVGFEVEAIHGITEEISWYAAFGYTRMVFDDYIDPFSGVDYAGNRPPYTPVYTLSAGVEYRARNGFFAAFGVRAAGTTWYDESNSQFFENPAHAVLSARFGLDYGPITVLGFARNLADSRYYSNKVVDLGAGVPGEPRSFGVKIEIEF